MSKTSATTEAIEISKRSGNSVVCNPLCPLCSLWLSRGGLFGILGGILGNLLAIGLILPVLTAAGEVLPEQHDVIVGARIARGLPGVVGILTDVSAEVTVRCGRSDVYVVKPDPKRENGTGFIIHPDGWIATNGHVVKPVYADEQEQSAEFLQAAVKAACGPGLRKLPEKQRKARLAAVIKDPKNRQGVKLTKKLLVFLPTVLPPGAKGRAGLAGLVKAYSPPIDPDLLPKDGSKPNPPMLDAALIKIEATNLPTVHLAPNIKQVYLGQQLFVVGYPGVVVWHDFLSRKSRAEATVTYGRVSAFRKDVNERPILQTDASISWGNSGGPAFIVNGEVVGVATFISTSLEGDQAIQGFNFLIPVDTIHDLAAQIGLMPRSDSPFMQEWEQAMELVTRGQFREALSHLDAADRIVPGLIDLDRVRARIQDGLKGAR